MAVDTGSIRRWLYQQAAKEKTDMKPEEEKEFFKYLDERLKRSHSSGSPAMFVTEVLADFRSRRASTS